MYIIALWNQIIAPSLLGKLDAQTSRHEHEMRSRNGRVNPSTGLSRKKERCSTLRTGGVTSFFACHCHILYGYILALGTHIRHLKATEPTRNTKRKRRDFLTLCCSYSISAPQPHRSESQGARTSRVLYP